MVQIPSLLAEVDPVQRTSIHANLDQFFSIGHQQDWPVCCFILDEGELGIELEELVIRTSKFLWLFLSALIELE